MQIVKNLYKNKKFMQDSILTLQIIVLFFHPLVNVDLKYKIVMIFQLLM